jgi:hypothetical protein
VLAAHVGTQVRIVLEQHDIEHPGFSATQSYAEFPLCAMGCHRRTWGARVRNRLPPIGRSQ